jgi:malic enzyme
VLRVDRGKKQRPDGLSELVEQVLKAFGFVHMEFVEWPFCFVVHKDTSINFIEKTTQL